jgi:hypothetical protein
MRLSIRLLSLTAVALLAAGSQSYAAFGDFSFATTASIAGGTPGLAVSDTVGSSTVSLAGSSGSTNASGTGTFINFGLNAVSTTLSTGSDTFPSTKFELFLALTSGGQTVTGDVFGSFSGTVTPSANDVTVSLTSYPMSLTAGGTTFELSNFQVTQSTLNGAPGSFSVHVQAVPVPEPTSIALLGLGGAGAFGVFRRRKALCNAC